MIKRIKLLSSKEYQEYFELPTFNYEEQKKLFSVDLIKEKLDRLNTLQSKIFFILDVGYFLANSRFFNFSYAAVKQDIKFILDHHFQGKTFKKNK